MNKYKIETTNTTSGLTTVVLTRMAEFGEDWETHTILAHAHVSLCGANIQEIETGSAEDYRMEEMNQLVEFMNQVKKVLAGYIKEEEEFEANYMNL